MAIDSATEQAISNLSLALNQYGLQRFDPDRIQAVIDRVCGDRGLTVDAGGGLHQPGGTRVGAIRRTDSGEWIIDSQNPGADNSGAEIPGAS